MNEHREIIDAFDSVGHFHDLARAAGVLVSNRAEIYYSYGWADIVKDFLNTIHGAGAAVHKLQAEFGALEIICDVENKRNETTVWRAIAVAHEKSKRTCELCGDLFSKRAVLRQDVKVLCPDSCRHAVEETIAKMEQENKAKHTRTWLDDY